MIGYEMGSSTNVGLHDGQYFIGEEFKNRWKFELAFYLFIYR